ncbi:2-hydroxyacyl-CoA dehydratase [Anaerorhabdus furcosa]|uniref:Predicted nucleotide-binding protein, sugar kinase/HSP70/actin superfamily n=1 Tax=Anaerorhabdus furcosa TaxID=118967 RepID=A0A1T4PGW7_9FIRM|nr:2-hydroxyacyl-CoA dehydratase [Anaerorhabdus furcosa]SJZ90759.1 Predicted nucleotide-binding protein, sugar kinase/HSP70/actin superfamily [Anaerorhabdus furcosa]
MTDQRIEFTKEMKGYKILAPNMLPIHFSLLCNVFKIHGYDAEILENVGPSVTQNGLKYVHNDTCYPALLVIGQLIDALNSGKYDVNKTALMITQTGGGCRASNYIHLLRKALVKAGYSQVPVISLNLSGLEKNSGFKFTLKMIRQALMTLIYGDMIMLLNNQIEPYEVIKGASKNKIQYWIQYLTEEFSQGRGLSYKDMKKNLKSIINDFDTIEKRSEEKIKVGIVGEIYIKYSALGNNHLEKFLLEQNCEVMVPGVMGFMLFKADNRMEDIKLYGGNPIKYKVVSVLFNYIQKLESAMIEVVKENGHFQLPSSYMHLKKLIKGYVGYGNKMGEGWLLTAEMLELIESGYNNIVCAQPFGCLPNHIVGKGMTRKIREHYPTSNIVPIDYDPSATRVNQENRIKLMLAIAKENANQI